jgi:flagellar hook-length control protein FliK
VLAQQTTAANPPAVSGSNSDPGSQFAIEEGTDPGQAVPRTAASPSSGAAGPASPSQAAARTAAPTSPSTTLAPVDAAATSSGAQALAPDALTTQLPTAQNGVTSSIRFGIAPQTGQPLHVPANSMAFQIARNFENGVNRFEIRIDPPELGRVNVRLDMSVEGRAQAHLTVDRPETLDLMLRDARVLERALSDAGLNTDRNSLSFSLKDEGGLGAGPHGENGNASPAGDADAVEEDTTVANAVQGYISDTGIDISV